MSINTKRTEEERKALTKLITAKCEENEFVRSSHSYYGHDDPFVDINDDDYGLKFSYFDTLAELKEAFGSGCLRSVYIYKDLIFVNELIDGWEAWTLKRFGDKLIGFESISIRLIIDDGYKQDDKKLTFEEYIEQLNSLTENQVIFYMQNELTEKELEEPPSEWENAANAKDKICPFCTHDLDDNDFCPECKEYVEGKPNVTHAWEVKEELYNKHKVAGGLCQKANGKFYIA